MVLRPSNSDHAAPAQSQSTLPYPVTPTSEQPSAPHSSKLARSDSQSQTDTPLDHKLQDINLRSIDERSALPPEASATGPDSEASLAQDVPPPLNVRKSVIAPLEASEQSSVPSILQIQKPSISDGCDGALQNQETAHELPTNTPEQPSELDGSSLLNNDAARNTNPFREQPNIQTFNPQNTPESIWSSPDTELPPNSSGPTLSPAAPNSAAALYQEERAANPFRQSHPNPSAVAEYASQPDSTNSNLLVSQNPVIPSSIEEDTATIKPRNEFDQAPPIPVAHNSNQLHSRDTSHVSLKVPHQVPKQPPTFSEVTEQHPAFHSQPQAPTNQTQLNLQASREEANKQRNEVYQIRHIRWHDANSSKNPRQTPVLMQNANGPCPLLALVNALALTTPSESSTALIETLRVREQVSLGLLLDAVFDELTSGRRGATAELLPDVGDLYSFLVTLHTGMNVNPRFVPSRFQEKQSHLAGLNLSLAQGNPRSELGGFEQTREMKLYSTFAIPLIHGWIPMENDAAHVAFDKIAPTYEDAQNVLFKEEELEEKLKTDSLSLEEQDFFLDLTNVKEFLSTWPTQLTDHGLASIKRTIKPAQVAILFRNDHFSTLYKEPQTNELMTLVTDAGYATHDEIVWENLADISGTRSELFAGDFKSVIHQQSSAPLQGDGEWTTVESRSRWRHPVHPQPGQNTPTATQAPNEVQQPGVNERAEQEDRDLALALQLQEEEEERQRNEQAARRSEQRLSEQYLSQDSANERSSIPPRRNNLNNSQESNDVPPPYEQAANGRRFNPPNGPPPNQQGQRRNNQGHRVGGQRQTNQQNNTQGGRRRNNRQTLVEQIPATPFDGGRGRQNEYASSNSVSDRREGCNVM